MSAQKRKSGASPRTTASRNKKTGTSAKKRRAASTPASKSRPSKAAPKKKPSRLLIVCLIVVFWALSIITMLRLGAAGGILYGLLSLLAGSYTYILLLGGMAWTFCYIWNGGQERLDGRMISGLLFLGMAWCAGCALLEMPQSDPYALWHSLIQNSSAIAAGQQTTWYGLLGAGLAGLLTALFAKAGAWIMTAAFALVGAALCGWNVWRQWWLEYKSQAPQTRFPTNGPGKKTSLLSPSSWLPPLFGGHEPERQADGFEELPAAGFYTQSLQQSGPDPLMELNLGIQAEQTPPASKQAGTQKKKAASAPVDQNMPDLLLFEQDLAPQSSLQTKPFSFEKAAQLLDAQPDSLLNGTAALAQAGSAGNPDKTSHPAQSMEDDFVVVEFPGDTLPSAQDKSGRLFGKKLLDPVSKVLNRNEGGRPAGLKSKRKASRTLPDDSVHVGLGITADGPAASGQNGLDISLPSFLMDPTTPPVKKPVTSGFGILADPSEPLCSGPDPLYKDKGSPAPSSEQNAGDALHPAAKPSKKTEESPSARARKQASLQMEAGKDLPSQNTMTDLASLPGKTSENVTRSRIRPAETAEPALRSCQLPAASSTDLSHYKPPKIQLLNDPGRSVSNNANAVQARKDGAKLISILNEFGVKADLNDIHIGPSVTKFEITPGQGVRVNSITNLQNDIKMALAATDIRIEAPIPGKSAVGIEVPNVEKTEVSMRDLLRTLPKKYANMPLVFALGKDLLGDNVYGRLDTMPHLLIAGATGSGKSVCVNAIISSILMRTRPDEVKLILVDPKKVEFTPYNGVPHLLAPVITDGDLANKALQVVVAMMDRRYDLFEETMVRNITAYNAYVDQNPDSHYKKLPRIVVIIDELADLMLAAAKEVEQSIQRITQLARAAGIHLIVATQRPSVNVITGVIKANIPSRIAFAVSSTVDSRTILDQAGAERLLGYGDMLFLDNGDSAPRRIQGVYIKDEEVMRIAEYVKSQAAPMYDDAFITLKDLQNQGGQVSPMDVDPLYEEVKHFVVTSRKASTSLIQRRFSIGYARAARLVDALESNGVVGPANGSKPREILAAPNYDPDDLDI